jgi:hypothetical protein
MSQASAPICVCLDCSNVHALTFMQLSDLRSSSKLIYPLYNLLLLAARLDVQVWSSLKEDERFDELHGEVLLRDESISGPIMQGIKTFCREDGAPDGKWSYG